jgi:type IV pilus assembly protein PilY1
MKANKLILKTLAFGLGASLALAGRALAAPTDIATQPLAQPASNVPPNVMLLLDDSGSMIQQYTPDYLGRYFGGSNHLCFDSLDDGSSTTIQDDLDNCEAGDPPLMSPDINTQYYNPEIRYYAAVNYDGTSKGDMDAAATSNWTVVPTDNVSSSGNSTFHRDTLDMNSGGGTVNTSDLVNNYPDRAWCKSSSNSPTDTVNCRVNSAYSYPDVTFGHGKSGSKILYRLLTTEYCSDVNLTTCTSSTAPTGAYVYPAPVRYCSDVALTNCQAKHQGSYTRPKFTGQASTSGTAQAASATIIVKNPQSDTSAGSINAINVNGVNIIPSTPVINEGPSFTPNNAAADIVAAINLDTGTSGYSASRSNNVVTVTATSTGPGPNGYSLLVDSPVISSTPASTSFGVSGSRSSRSVSSMTVNDSMGNVVANLTPSVSCPSTCSDSTMAGAIASAITGGGSGYTAIASGSTVTITAPSNSGGEINNLKLAVSTTSFRLNAGNGSTFSGGQSTGDVETLASGFTGGQDANSGHINVGQFVRTNIVSTQPSYTKYPGRTDCLGATCTYAEEMTNFANWYAYYRMRDTMAKTAIGRAFAALSDQYRVGFITINPGNPVQSSRYLKVDAFAAGAGNQKDLWYQHLYDTGSNGSTPLREALSRVGRYYAGKTTGINSGMDASPIEYACQPNYTLAMTDGYWNGNAGDDLNGNGIGNYDNSDSGYSTRAIGAYDGGLKNSTDTLADVAMYYYMTDLRTDLANSVPTTQNDPAPFQHMTTFTVGLGLAGQLNFDPNYISQTSGDFFDIKQGVKNWPSPSADSETALDDLWHAAVNGHGQFFSAKDPVTLAQGISETLQQVSSRVGAGAAAATSNLQPVAGDNFAFTAQYQTVEWTGDVIARTIDLNSGIVASRALWSAQALLDQRDGTGRHIYTYDPTDTPPSGTGNLNKLRALCWPLADTMTDGFGNPLYPGCVGEDQLSSADLTNYFDPATLTQAGGWSALQAGSASAQKLIDYLRGDTSNYDTGASLASDLFRKRQHLLGDVVDAQPAYVKGSPFDYDIGAYAGTDPYYQAFKLSTQSRKGTVYVAANDGMLHAFETDPDNNPYYQTAGIATTTTTDDAFTGTLDTNPASGEGSERWAYVPGLVLPEIKNLANEPYIHEYTTDGSPAIGDVCFSPCGSQANWHTILVAGLNGGGRGYYALDVTDPNNPKALWELKGGSDAAECLTSITANDGGNHIDDCNIGLSFGNPIITKRKSDGKWVVIVTSGYNNIIPGDGQGHLYVVDAQTGVILNRIDTNVGNLATPSGLARINAWVDNAFNDNTTLRVYGGDLQGNVWRFQLDPSEAGYMTAYKLATLTDASSVPQPITARPELGEVQGFSVVYVGTGKLLGTSDTATTPPPQTQSIYAIRDDLTSGGAIDPRAGSMVQQTLTPIDSATRTASANPVDFNTDKGWFIDLPDSGERVNVDPILQLGTLVVPSNVPSADSCVAGGYGWINFLDYRSGTFVPGATADMASTKIAASLVVGINVVQLPGGKVVTIVTTADNQQLTQETPVSPPSVSGRRVTWRELITE